MMRINKSTKAGLVFPIICGIIATLWQYKFGDADQLDHLLFVYKALDPEFLNNDAYVSLAGSFSVRYYFAHFIALFASLMPIELAYFIFTLLANVATAIASFMVAKEISKNYASGLIACILVMTITTISMGDVPTIYATGLAPDRLAFPLVLFAFYWALKNYPINVALFAGVASLFHIMLGAVCGGVFLLAMFANNQNRKNKTYVLTLFKALSALFAFSLFTLVPYLSTKAGSIPTQEFIHIYAHFRVPHHLVPSYIFSNGIGVRSLAFFIGAAVSGYLLYKTQIVHKKQLSYITVVVFIFFTFCILGYLFIEIFPNRISVLLQAFRYLTFVKWLAFILVGTYVGKMLADKKTFVSGLYLFISVLSPFLMFFSFCFEAFNKKLNQLHKNIKYLPYLGLILVLAYFSYKSLNPETVILAIYLILFLAFFYLPKAVARLLLLAYGLFIFVNITWLSKAGLQNKWFTQNFNPVFTFNQKVNTKINMALKINEYLPKDAVLLAPPNMLEVKTIGKRATVVSFKAVPFGDVAIKKWKQQLDFCYGQTQNVGFGAEQDLVQNYKQITDTDLLRIKEKYGAEYAILFHSTETDLKILYQNQHYKLVKLRE